MDLKLPAILKGESKPRDAVERLALADVCFKTRRHAAAARFANEAFAEKPALADDLQTWARYNAACSASLAGSGQGKDDPMPDEAARAKLREQALDWLRADLASWVKVFDGGIDPPRKQGGKDSRPLEDRPRPGRHPRRGEPGEVARGRAGRVRALWADVERFGRRRRGERASELEFVGKRGSMGVRPGEYKNGPEGRAGRRLNLSRGWVRLGREELRRWALVEGPRGGVGDSGRIRTGFDGDWVRFSLVPIARNKNK